MKNAIISTIASAIIAISVAGCKCEGCGNDKPVAPETFSNEQGGGTEPSLPYMKPWWKN